MKKPAISSSFLAPVLIGGLFLLLVVGYVVELPRMMNYLEVGNFWQHSLIAGACLGVLVARLVDRPLADGVQRLRSFFAIFFFLLLLTPLLWSWTNRWFSPAARTTMVIFESELARYGDRFGRIKDKAVKANTYVLFFLLENELYRVTAKAPFFPDAEEGEQVQLGIRKGNWGYRWVEYPTPL